MPARPANLSFNAANPASGGPQSKQRGGSGNGNRRGGNNARRKQAWPHNEQANSVHAPSGRGGGGQWQRRNSGGGAGGKGQPPSGGNPAASGNGAPNGGRGRKTKNNGRGADWRQNSRSKLRRGTFNGQTGVKSSSAVPKGAQPPQQQQQQQAGGNRPRSNSGGSQDSMHSHRSASTVDSAATASSAKGNGAANWRGSRNDARAKMKNASERDRLVFRLLKNGDHEDRLRKLINHKGLEPTESFLRKTAQCASKFQRHKCLFHLIDECGLDVDTNLQKGCTALHYAAFAGCDSLCKGLMFRGANRDALNSYGENAAGTARSQGHEGCATVIDEYNIAAEHLNMKSQERREQLAGDLFVPPPSSPPASHGAVGDSPPGSPPRPASPPGQGTWRRGAPCVPESAKQQAPHQQPAAAYAEEDSAAAALEAILNPPTKQKRRVRRLVRSLQRLKTEYLDIPELITNVLIQIGQMEIFERQRVAKSLLRKVIVSEELPHRVFMVQLCAKMFEVQLEKRGKQEMEGRRSRGPSFDAAEPSDDMSIFSGSTGSNRTGSTLSTFGSRSPKAESDASSVGSNASALMLSGPPFLDTSLQLCEAEAARVNELLSGAVCFFEEDDAMIIENIEQLSAETLQSRLAVMNLLIGDLQEAREAAMAK